MRLINPKKAWETAQRIYSDPVLLHAIKNVLDSTEAIDVVRCKDCQHTDYSGCADGIAYCMEHSCYVNVNGFCSCGEREE